MSWERVEELFHGALALPASERPAYLDKACAGEAGLRAEVEALLKGADSQDGFLEGSPISGERAGRLAPGKMVGRFRIIDLVGTGGMGDVYKAHDTRLNRTVAVKMCRERFSERFEREARAIASLTHPNICTLYDVGPNYLVMEFLEGKPLRGPLPLDVALRYCLQAAEALHAAHSKGVVHRDFKPGNILVTASGVKLLDFGLAKVGAETLTLEHNIPGTLRYMAPEQLEGKPADTRSDIYAFGLVLHEAISGSPVFAASSPSTLISSILKTDPPLLSALQPGVPPALDRLVAKCLAKDPAERWQTVADLRDELRWIQQPSSSSVRVQTPVNDGRRKWLTAAGVGVVLLAGGLWWTAAARSGAPVVVLMDTSAPRGVYDPDTRLKSGTNADDLSDALGGLPVALHKETMGADWNREDQVARERPDLILIHRSAFAHALVQEFTPPPAAPAGSANPLTDEPFYDRLTRVGRDRLDALIGYLGKANERTRFIVYARDWKMSSREGWQSRLLKRFPQLEGRVTTLEVDAVDGLASFRQAQNAEKARRTVSSVLGLR